MTAALPSSAAAAPDGAGTAAAAAPLRGTALARYGGAAVLLLAAYLKWQQAVSVADFGGFGPHHKWGTIALVALEVFLAFWLLCGAYWPVVKWAAAAAFAAFAGYNAWRWLGGYATCGCFGAVKIDPRVTLGVDLALVALFLLSPSGPASALNRRVERRVAAVATAGALLLALPATAILTRVEPATITPRGISGGKATIVRLEPKSWVGQRLPLLPYLDPAVPEVARGNWLFVIWNPTCWHCVEAVPMLMEKARHDTNDRILIVNITETETPRYLLDAGEIMTRLRVVHLSRQYSWTAATPTYITLQDGVVRQVF